MTAPAPREPRASLYIRLLGFLFLVCAVFAAIDAARVWAARTADMRAARIGSANLTRALAQQAHDALQAADGLLLATRTLIEAEGMDAASLERLTRRIAPRLSVSSPVRELRVLDAGGIVLTDAGEAAGGAPLPGLRHHAAHADRALLIEPPHHADPDDAPVITLSRRIDRADGSFAGVVLATLPAALFQRFYDQVDVGRAGSIILALDDGTVLVQKPDDPSVAGGRVRDGAMLRDIVSGTVAGDFDHADAADGMRRFGSFRRVPSYPLVVVVACATDEVLAAWREEAFADLAATAVLLGAIAVLGLRLARQVRRTQEADSLYRLLADNSGDAIVCNTLDGVRRYASPAFSAMTGWTPGETLGLPMTGLVHPEDAPAVAAALERLRIGGEEVISTYRCRRRDGSYLWVEERMRLMPRRRGPAELVGNLRDITRRKAIEDQLRAANRELLALSAADSLTGLANRRRFDEALAVEWRRATRGRQPLSLILLDVDWFKRYNDTYGHPAGDDVLREVARRIAGALRRGGDLAARYGGEEFAVILPATDAPGCRQMAIQLREAIAACALPHRMSPLGRVSVSMGLASRVVGQNDSLATFIAQADAALYRAKRAGRDRIAWAEGSGCLADSG